MEPLHDRGAQGRAGRRSSRRRLARADAGGERGPWPAGRSDRRNLAQRVVARRAAAAAETGPRGAAKAAPGPGAPPRRAGRRRRRDPGCGRGAGVISGARAPAGAGEGDAAAAAQSAPRRAAHPRVTPATDRRDADDLVPPEDIPPTARRPRKSRRRRRSRRGRRRGCWRSCSGGEAAFTADRQPAWLSAHPRNPWRPRSSRLHIQD